MQSDPGATDQSKPKASLDVVYEHKKQKEYYGQSRVDQNKARFVTVTTIDKSSAHTNRDVDYV